MYHRRLKAACVVVLVAAASAAADLDAQITNGNVVTGTLSSPTTKDTFRVTCPAGAALTVTASGVKKRGASTPAVTFVVKDPNSDEIGSDKIVVKGTATTAKAIPIATTGVHSIVVTATAGTPGDFRLTATWKSPKAPPVAGVLSGGEATFEFTADAGAVVVFDVSPSPKSTALPRLLSVDGPEFAHPFDAPAATAKRHRVAGVVLPTTGAYTLRVGDGGAAGGAFRGKITVKPPAPVRTKLNLTDKAIGAATDHFAKVGTIGKSGGTIAAGVTGTTPIDGASVTIGEGTLKSPVTIVVATGDPLPAQGPGQSGVGPTVFFGPEGLKFGQIVTLTIPFDPAAFDGELTGLKVFTKNAKGQIAPVTSPLNIDLVAGTITFQTSHFSSYRVFGPEAPVRGDLNGDGFADLVVPAPGAGSGGSVFVYFGRADFLANPPTAPSATFTGIAAEDGLGSAVATGDVNGDGTADLVAGSRNAGAAYVFFGGPSFASTAAANADATLVGSAVDSGFGAPIVVADVTGDGIADVAVASVDASRGAVGNGAVYVFRGATNFQSASAGDASTIVFTGDSDLGAFGVAVAAGDVNGDRVADLAVGAQQNGVQGAGAVYVFAGGPSLASQTAGVSSMNFSGIAQSDHFGDAIAIGDFDHDGSGDLAVGAPFEDGAAAGEADFGRVHVFFGGTNLRGGSATNADMHIAFGNAASDLFGSSLVAGDVAGDAASDLLMSTPGHDELTDDEGRIDLALGGADFVDVVEHYSAFAQRDRFGVLFQPVDLDGDGRDEVIAGSSAHANFAGRVIVRFGPGLLRDRQVVIDGAPGDHLGGTD